MPRDQSFAPFSKNDDQLSTSMASHKYVQESEYEKQRRVRIAENQAMLSKIFSAEEFSWSKQSPRRIVKRQPRRQTVCATDLPRRRNPKRKAKCNSKYDSGVENNGSDENDDGATESPNSLIIKFNWHRGKRSKYSSSDEESPKRRRTSHPVTPVEITEADLVLVAERVADKKYDSQNGTTCHQCRQKTDDLKTVCRNNDCFGRRGQFCGPCLKNRYGEEAKEALMDSNWSCPPCRGICNCSFCMKKRGRSCTGIMIHIARERGFEDVKSFLGD